MHSSRYPLSALWATVLFAACAANTGCASRESANAMTCRVLIDGVPALEVRLVLLSSDNGQWKPVLEGTADFSGTIVLKWIKGVELPKDKETELIAMIESVGSGDWQLKKPWSDPKTTPLKIKWPAGPKLDIQLPQKAVRSI